MQEGEVLVACLGEILPHNHSRRDCFKVNFSTLDRHLWKVLDLKAVISQKVAEDLKPCSREGNEGAGALLSHVGSVEYPSQLVRSGWSFIRHLGYVIPPVYLDPLFNMNAVEVQPALHGLDVVGYGGTAELVALK